MDYHQKGKSGLKRQTNMISKNPPSVSVSAAKKPHITGQKWIPTYLVDSPKSGPAFEFRPSSLG
jgi:hypothetical protein